MNSKAISFSLIIFLFIESSFSQSLFFGKSFIAVQNGLVSEDKTKNDLKEMNLKGNIKSFKEVSYKAIKLSEDIKKGKRKREFPSLNKDLYIIFNNKGNIIEKHLDYSNGNSYSKSLYKYNEIGDTINDSIYKRNGHFLKKNQYTRKYDSKGNIIERNYLKSDGSNQKITYNYDDKGNMVESNQYKKDGSLYMKTISTYDDKRNKIEWDMYESKGNSLAKVVCKYDSASNRIEETWFSSTRVINEEFIYKYNDKGNIIENTSRTAIGNGLYTQLKFQYEYDKYGNWIKCTQYKFTGTKNSTLDKPDYILEREIEYF